MFFSKRFLAAVVFFLVALGVRLPGLGDFMTADEANWMDRSRLMINNTVNWNLVDTFLSTHPGATTMWLSGAGIKLQEARFGEELSEDNQLHFRKAATVPLALATSLLVGLIVWLLWGVAGSRISMFAGIFLAADPFLVGMSQIVHLDALQSLLMLAALLSFMSGVRQRLSVGYLLLAGVLMGLAMANRLVFVGPLIAIMFLYLLLQKTSWQNMVRTAGLVLGPVVMVFYATWPAMWFYDDVARSFVRDTGQVITDEHVQFKNIAEQPVSPVAFYLRTFESRVPPHIQVLALAAAAGALYQLARQRRRLSSSYLVLATLSVYALGFLILITFAAKKADRYAMPALVVFPVLSAWAVDFALNKTNNQNIKKYLLPITALAVIALPLLWTPHAIAYNNPLFKNVRPLSQQGWGEGLEAATGWLNELPNSDHLTISSWYADVARTYFNGTTFRLSSRNDYRVSYLVAYRNMMGREPDSIASDVLDEFVDAEPVHVVEIGGQPYAWIYRTNNVGEYIRTLGELLPGRQFGQLIETAVGDWDHIELGLATYGRENLSGSVTLHVREDLESKTDLRTVTVPFSEIVDNAWHRFEFSEINAEPGDQFYVFLTTANGSPENSITARYTDFDLNSGVLVVDGETKTGDLAYRID